jgi:predicted GNAT family N-acyltransferase
VNIILSRESLSREPELLRRWLPKLFDDAMFLRASYPEFDNWLLGKVVPGLHTGERTILVEQRGSETAGVLVLKHSAKERKLCTLRVRPSFEATGLGVRLFEKAFEVLGTERPLLSVSETTQPKFVRLFEHFGFLRQGSYEGLYVPMVHEFSYNGLLEQLPLCEVPTKARRHLTHIAPIAAGLHFEA